jgi:hypothetical protein
MEPAQADEQVGNFLERNIQGMKNGQKANILYERGSLS